MSKEPNKRRFAAGTVTPEPGVPYRKLPNTASSRSYTRAPTHTSNSSAGAVVPASSTAGVAPRQGPPRLTINNYATFQPRVKRLPPDANTKAAVNTKLWQFPEQVLFACAKCRRDNIQSDSVAIDPRNRIILCTSCFTRIVRPRAYRPSRVVPFPSLLSWLNYKPSKVMEVAEDVMARPAEAVAPSGNRMALPMLASGDRPTSVEKLPAIGMNIVPAAGSAATSSSANLHGGDLYAVGSSRSRNTPDGKHPCLRVWGVCQHGEICLFRNAPADLCLAYLMGLCKGGPEAGEQRSEEEKRTGRKPRPCQLLHQRIYDLPHPSDPCPHVRYIGEIEGEEEREDEAEESPWVRWIARRRKSPNSAEWQLWNNGALKTIFDVYIPAVGRPVKAKPRKPQEVKEEAQTGEKEEEEVQADDEGTVQAGEKKVVDEEDGVDKEEEKSATVKLNLSDILSGLKSIKK